MRDMEKTVTSAVVVGFLPDLAVLVRLLTALSPQVDHLILMDNGGASAAYEQARLQGLVLDYIDLGDNKGLGHALNAGFERAVARGARFVATFDQDSAPPDDLVKHLLQAHEELEEAGIRCAAVGPAFFDRREARKIYFPFYVERAGRITAVAPYQHLPGSGLVEVDTLITSGMLVRAAVWSGGVNYDEKLFVDYTDTDWCFRARAEGFKLFGCSNTGMGHALSDATPRRVLGFNFFSYSPLRRYYYFRNTLIFCRAAYVSAAWRRRLMTGLFLRFFVNMVIDQQPWPSFKMMMLGLRHGVQKNQTGRLDVA